MATIGDMLRSKGIKSLVTLKSSAGRPTHRYFSYAEACATAANLSDYRHGSGVEVNLEPLVSDGEEIQGEATVAYFEKGRMIFPHLQSTCVCK